MLRENKKICSFNTAIKSWKLHQTIDLLHNYEICFLMIRSMYNKTNYDLPIP